MDNNVRKSLSYDIVIVDSNVYQILGCLDNVRVVWHHGNGINKLAILCGPA